MQSLFMRVGARRQSDKFSGRDAPCLEPFLDTLTFAGFLFADTHRPATKDHCGGLLFAERFDAGDNSIRGSIEAELKTVVRGWISIAAKNDHDV